MRMTLFPSKEMDDIFFDDINVKTEGLYRILNKCFEESIWDEYLGLTKDGRLIKDTVDMMMKDELSIADREALLPAYNWTGKLIIENETYVDELFLLECVVSLIFVWELPVVRGHFDIKKRKLVTSTYRFYKMEI